MAPTARESEDDAGDARRLCFTDPEWNNLQNLRRLMQDPVAMKRWSAVGTTESTWIWDASAPPYIPDHTIIAYMMVHGIVVHPHAHAPQPRRRTQWLWPPTHVGKIASIESLVGGDHGVPATKTRGIVKTAHTVIHHGTGSRSRWTVELQGNDAADLAQLREQLATWCAACGWMMETKPTHWSQSHYVPRWRAGGPVWRVVTLNVGSLSGAERQHAIAAQLQDHAIAAAVLQETRLVSEDVATAALAGYQLYLLPAPQRGNAPDGRRGLAIAVDNRFVSQRVAAVAGQYVLAVRMHTGRMDKPCVLLYCFYAPLDNAASKAAWAELRCELTKAALHHPNTPLILGGDFNCTKDEVDAWLTEEDGSNGYTCARPDSTLSTTTHSVASRQIDHLVVNGPADRLLGQPAVQQNQWHPTATHRAVVATVQLSDTLEGRRHADDGGAWRTVASVKPRISNQLLRTHLDDFVTHTAFEAAPLREALAAVAESATTIQGHIAAGDEPTADERVAAQTRADTASRLLHEAELKAARAVGAVRAPAPRYGALGDGKRYAHGELVILRAAVAARAAHQRYRAMPDTVYGDAEDARLLEAAEAATRRWRATAMTITADQRQLLAQQVHERSAGNPALAVQALAQLTRKRRPQQPGLRLMPVQRPDGTHATTQHDIVACWDAHLARHVSSAERPQPDIAALGFPLHPVMGETAAPFEQQDLLRAIARERDRATGIDGLSATAARAMLHTPAPAQPQQHAAGGGAARTPSIADTPYAKACTALALGCANTGCIADCDNIAIGSPHPKPGKDEMRCENHRIIFVNTLQHRLLMGMAVARVTEAMTTSKRWHPTAFGFRPDAGAETEVIALHQLLQWTASQPGGKLFVALYDAREAFDRLSHSIIRAGNVSMGIAGHSLQLLMAEHANAAAVLRLGDAVTSTHSRTSGCAQGSRASPQNYVLSTITVVAGNPGEIIAAEARAPDCGAVAGVPGMIYADDTLTIAQTPGGLRASAARMESRTAAAGVDLNASKSMVVAFGASAADRADIGGNPPTLSGAAIRLDPSAVLLGLALVPRPLGVGLDLEAMAHHRLDKMKGMWWALRPTAQNMAIPLWERAQLYRQTVQQSALYGAAVWAGQAEKTCRLMQRLQDTAVLTMVVGAHGKLHLSATALHIELGVAPILAAALQRRARAGQAVATGTTYASQLARAAEMGALPEAWLRWTKRMVGGLGLDWSDDAATLSNQVREEAVMDWWEAATTEPRDRVRSKRPDAPAFTRDLSIAAHRYEACAYDESSDYLRLAAAQYGGSAVDSDAVRFLTMARTGTVPTSVVLAEAGDAVLERRLLLECPNCTMFEGEGEMGAKVYKPTFLSHVLLQCTHSEEYRQEGTIMAKLIASLEDSLVAAGVMPQYIDEEVLSLLLGGRSTIAPSRVRVLDHWLAKPPPKPTAAGGAGAGAGAAIDAAAAGAAGVEPLAPPPAVALPAPPVGAAPAAAAPARKRRARPPAVPRSSMPLYLRIAHWVRACVLAHISGARSFDDEGKTWLVRSLRRAKTRTGIDAVTAAMAAASPAANLLANALDGSGDESDSDQDNEGDAGDASEGEGAPTAEAAAGAAALAQ